MAGTGGGTRITITGRGFAQLTNATSVPTVLLGPVTEPGVPCLVDSATYSKIVCDLTANQRPYDQPLQGANLITVSLGGKTSADCGAAASAVAHLVNICCSSVL